MIVKQWIVCSTTLKLRLTDFQFLNFSGLLQVLDDE